MVVDLVSCEMVFATCVYTLSQLCSFVSLVIKILYVPDLIHVVDVGMTGSRFDKKYKGQILMFLSWLDYLVERI